MANTGDSKPPTLGSNPSRPVSNKRVCMITTLGNIGGEESSRASQAETGSHRIIAPGARYGQLVDVVERGNGYVVCVYNGNRFRFSESDLEVVAEDAAVEVEEVVEVKAKPRRTRWGRKKK